MILLDNYHKKKQKQKKIKMLINIKILLIILIDFSKRNLKYIGKRKNWNEFDLIIFDNLNIRVKN